MTTKSTTGLFSGKREHAFSGPSIWPDGAGQTVETPGKMPSEQERRASGLIRLMEIAG